VAAACKADVAAFIRDGRRPLLGEEAQRLATFRTDRLAGKPVSRILGRREFWELSFAIDDTTLDPRPDTELLVELCLEEARKRCDQDTPLSILDLGAGTGCILAALLVELPAARGVAVDIQLGALRVARENIKKLGLLPRASFLCADWALSLKPCSFDIVVSNPPYIRSDVIKTLDLEVRNYDPLWALDGGEDGLRHYKAIIPQVAKVLKPGGFFALEIGFDQADQVMDLVACSFKDLEARSLRAVNDLGGNPRAVAAKRQSGLAGR
jgi:release factor glutamine methyltransferase